MLARIIFLATAFLAPVVAHAQEPGTDLALEISLRTYHVDERVRGSAGDHGIEPFGGYVWTSATLCQVGASDNEPSSVPAIGWHFSGRVIERGGDEFFVAIEWRRLWFNSVRLTDGANGVMQVRMRTDRRLELDVVGPLAASPCGMAGARLEAAIVARPRVRMPLSLKAVEIANAALAAGRGGTGTVVRPMPKASFLAELWLVHKRPDGVEESQKYSASVGESGTPFLFPSVTVPTEGGPVVVAVSGQIKPVLVNEVANLQLSMRRSVGSMGGGTFTTLPMPAAGEVLSFELPPPRGPEPLGHHAFSLRLRVTSK